MKPRLRGKRTRVNTHSPDAASPVASDAIRREQMTLLGKKGGEIRAAEIRAKLEPVLLAAERQWLKSPPLDGKKPSLQAIYSAAGIGKNTLNGDGWETLLGEVKERIRLLGNPPGSTEDADDLRTDREKAVGKRLSIVERLSRWRKAARDLRQRNIEAELEISSLTNELQVQRLKVGELEGAQRALQLDIINLSKRLSSALGTNVVTLKGGDNN